MLNEVGFRGKKMYGANKLSDVNVYFSLACRYRKRRIEKVQRPVPLGFMKRVLEGVVITPTGFPEIMKGYLGLSSNGLIRIVFR